MILFLGKFDIILMDDIGSKERQNFCFKVTKRILIANIFRPLKDHVHSNKINENVDI